MTTSGPQVDSNAIAGQTPLERPPPSDGGTRPAESASAGLVPPEILEKMPPEVRSTFEQVSLLMRSGPSPDPLRQKITG